MTTKGAEQTYFILQDDLEKLTSSVGFSSHEFKDNIASFSPEIVESALRIMKQQLACVERILEADLKDVSNVVFIADYQF